MKGTLKHQLATIRPVLEDLRLKKDERIKEFSKIQSQISQICAEIAVCGQSKNVTDPEVDQCDLTVKKLGELKSHLQELQNEKVLPNSKHSHTIFEIPDFLVPFCLMLLPVPLHPDLAPAESEESYRYYQ